ncbi:MFS transporter [Desulfobacula phenolica]|uniref:MFS transporter, PPP family, 3-phenylpropionic acid transporter n=1 Tax=Desulfobacula phenolica TaxID=90732 RepID=A0A1H2IMH2_9BACT|nr:MFS transporter [Desulfobacula phenolica]SDU45357.1 MFS transporter, PPP family, 3-phenylpropionic acid transporter [Desulfobacula phenolica]
MKPRESLSGSSDGILKIQYFIYFGVMGIFLPYFNLYCHHLGFSSFEIGSLSALRTAITIVFSIGWSIVADRYAWRKPIYVLFNFLSAAIWVFFLYIKDFSGMVIVTIFHTIFFAPLIAFIEAFAMDELGSGGGDKNRYGRIRAWGSVSFILVVAILGKISDFFSVNIIVALILAGYTIQAIFSIPMPQAKARGERFHARVREILNARTLIFLTCSFLMIFSHGTYYGFYSIHLDKLGYGTFFIGATWAVASIAEIVIMINSGRILKYVSLENVLFFSFLAATVRWCLLWRATTVSEIMIAQVLHAFTYGTFHIASILYMDLLSTGETRTLGQAVNNAVSYGLGMMAGFLLNGYLYEAYGALLFLMSACVSLVGAFVLKFLGR